MVCTVEYCGRVSWRNEANEAGSDFEHVPLLFEYMKSGLVMKSKKKIKFQSVSTIEPSDLQYIV